jgi:hypothetical protein
MDQKARATRPQYHRERSRSLESTDSLEMLEAYQQNRQQFVPTTAELNHDQALPSTPKPQAVSSYPPASQNYEDNAQLLLVPPTNQIDAFSTLSYTSETSSSVSSGDKFDAKTAPLPHEQSHSITSLSEIIQVFTSEVMISEIPSLKLESQSSMKESLDSEASDGTHSLCESTTGSFTQTPMVPPTFHGNAPNHDILQPVVLAAPLQTPNLLKQTEALDQHSDIECDVTICHLSDSSLHPNSAEPLVKESLVTNTDTVASKRDISLQMQPTHVTNSEALLIDIDTPVYQEVNTFLTAVPFRPPEWKKLPVTNNDQTCEAQSQISLLSSSTLEVAVSSTQTTAVFEPLQAKSILVHSYPVTEGSTSDKASVSSLPYLKSQEQRINDPIRFKNFTSEKFAKEVIRPQKTPNIPLSPQKKTDSVDFVSKDESENKRERINTRFLSKGQSAVRSGTPNFQSSFKRRSQTPSVSVKSLIQKFSGNN